MEQTEEPRRIAGRLYQCMLVVSMLLLSWLGMMIVHELGHCLHAWLSGGVVAKVVLHPLAISVTEFTYNPHPLFVAWGGPLVGVLLPVIILIIVRVMRVSAFYLFQFFAGFCLVINGIYIAEDSFFRAADSATLIAYGSPQWLLIAFGVVTVIIGLYLWNGLGPYFGLGEAKGKVSHGVAITTFVALVAVVLAEVLLSSR